MFPQPLPQPPQEHCGPQEQRLDPPKLWRSAHNAVQLRHPPYPVNEQQAPRPTAVGLSLTLTSIHA